MEMNESAHSPVEILGAKLKAARTLADLSQDAVGKALGMTARAGHVYVSKLERGKVPEVSFWTVVRYVQACKVQVGKFMLELAQSGAFGEVEGRISSTDYTDYADKGSSLFGVGSLIVTEAFVRLMDARYSVVSNRLGACSSVASEDLPA